MGERLMPGTFARFKYLALAAAICALCPAPAWAGMPAPFVLREMATLRLEAISFFLAILLLSAAAIQWLWNGLRTSFTRLPRLSYGKAVSVVILWGLLFSVVLAMISGARELMTPGAWKRQGATYQLRTDGR